MKKIYLLILIGFALFSFQSYAQCPGCVVNTGCTSSPIKPTICPDTLPSGQAGIAYDEDASFFMPAQFTDQNSGLNVTLNKITVTAVVGVPYGLSFQANSATYEYFPSSNPPTSEYGCVKFCGTPLIPGQYVITVYVTAEVTALGINQTEYDSFELPVEILPSTSGNTSFTISNPQGCAPLTTTFTSNMPSTGNPAYSYSWDFGNGNQSTQEAPPAQTYYNPGVYYINLQTEVDTLGYYLDEVTIVSSSCTDATSKPDHYIKIYEGSTKIYEYPHNASMNNDSPVTLSFATIDLKDTTYTIEVWDDDNFLGGQDDLCGTFTFNGHTAGTHSLFDGSTVINFTIDHPILNFDDTDSVIVFPTPILSPLSVYPADTVCNTDTVYLTINGQSPNQYQWFKDGILLSSETDSVLKIFDESGFYHAKVINSYSCYDETVPLFIEFLPTPTTPTFWSNGNTLTSLASGTLQWYLDSVAIPGANQQSYTISQTGNYMLCVTNASNCSSCSNEMYAIYSSINDYQSLVKMNVYPNPTSGIFTLEMFGIADNQVEIFITDLTSRIVMEDKADFHSYYKKEINLQHVDKGAYIIHIKSDKGTAIEKIIIQ
jgi:PKD repeat protein